MVESATPSPANWVIRNSHKTVARLWSARSKFLPRRRASSRRRRKFNVAGSSPCLSPLADRAVSGSATTATANPTVVRPAQVSIARRKPMMSTENNFKVAAKRPPAVAVVQWSTMQLRQSTCVFLIVRK